LGINVRKNYSDGNQTTISLECNEKNTTTILVNRTKSVYNDSESNFRFEEDKKVNTSFKFNETSFNLSIIVDRSSVEAFFFDGLYSITNLVFGDSKAKGIELFVSDDSKAWIDTLRVTVLTKAVPFKKEQNIEMEN